MTLRSQRRRTSNTRPSTMLGRSHTHEGGMHYRVPAARPSVALEYTRTVVEATAFVRRGEHCMPSRRTTKGACGWESLMRSWSIGFV